MKEITKEYLEQMIENNPELKYYKDMVTPKGKPTERWVNEVPIEACIEEYKLIQNKTSHCSSAQRKHIQERVEKHLTSQK